MSRLFAPAISSQSRPTLAVAAGASMSWLLAFIAKWRAARSADRLRRVQDIVNKGLSAIE
jgi:hypothetical protein